MQRKISQKRGRRGYVLVTMGVASIALFGALGLAVDVGRMYIAKNETQAYCDAAALSAALKLDGASTGITAAQTTVASSSNPWNIGSTTITGSQVDFATSASGPWVANPASPSGYTYARVRVTVPLPLYFMPMLSSQYTQNVGSLAVGAQIAKTSLTRGLVPYSVVSTDAASPNFGLTVGGEYDIQWPQYNGSKSGCGPGNPDKCFNQPPCADDVKASKSAVVQYWGASVNGYWGSNSNSTIEQEVLNEIQLQPVSIGQQMTMSSGNKNSEAKALDDRVNEDLDTTDNTVSGYLNSAARNGRRLIAVPVLNPTAAGTFVIGYAGFLLLSNGNPSNFYTAGSGNDPFCALYAGPYVQGAISPGASGGAGSFRVMLVQ